jgi:hypothetical protein
MSARNPGVGGIRVAGLAIRVVRLLALQTSLCWITTNTYRPPALRAPGEVAGDLWAAAPSFHLFRVMTGRTGQVYDYGSDACTVVVGGSCVVAGSSRRSLDGGEDASGGQACAGERLWWRFALSGHHQESIVIEAWTTGAERQQELIDGLLELFKRFRSSDGFVEARILKGSGGTTVLSYLRMRSAADEQRLHEEPGIQAALEALRKIARPHRDLFDLVWVFTPPSDEGAVFPSRGAY